MASSKHRFGHVSLRLVLVVPFVLQVIVAVGITGWLALQNGQKAIRDLAVQLENEISERVEQHLESYLSAPQQINQMNAEAMRLRLLDIEDVQQLERTFWHQTATFDHVSYVYFALEETGGYIGTGRHGEGEIVIEATENYRVGDFLAFSTDRYANRVELIRRDANYDPRVRPWYTSAVRNGTATWSDVYAMFPDMILAITAVTPVYEGDRRLQGVFASDITLSGISQFLQNLDIGISGEVFIIERSGLLIATSTEQMPFTTIQGDDEPDRLMATEIDVPIIQTAATELLREFGGFRGIDRQHSLMAEINNERQFIQVVPFQDQLGLDWLIVVVVPESDFMQQINLNTRNTVLLCTGVLGLAIALSVITARWITKPIERLTVAAQLLANGNLDQTIGTSRILEFNGLAASFEEMRRQLQQSFSKLAITNAQLEERVIERTNELSQTVANLKQTQAQLVQTEKMSSLGQMVAGVAHEINNPINFIQGNLGHASDYSQQMIDLIDLYQRQYPQPSPQLQQHLDEIDFDFMKEDFPRLLHSMDTGAQRIAEIVKSLRNFSRLEEADRKPANIHEGIDSTLMILHHRFKRKSTFGEVVLKKVYGNLPLVECYPGPLNQVFMNILSNALDALDERDRSRSFEELQAVPSWVEIRTTCDVHHGEDWVTICIADNGMGMTPETRSRLFDPFFTTKEVGKGTGLGLSISYQIVVERHGGQIEVNSVLGQGTEFVIRIPVYPPRHE